MENDSDTRKRESVTSQEPGKSPTEPSSSTSSLPSFGDRYVPKKSELSLSPIQDGDVQNSHEPDESPSEPSSSTSSLSTIGER